MGALLAVAGIFAAIAYSFQCFVSIRHYEPETLADRFDNTPNPIRRYVIWFFAARRSPDETASFRWFSLAGMVFFLFSWLLMHVNYLFLHGKYGADSSNLLEMFANLVGIFACCFLALVFLMGTVFISLPAFGQKPAATPPEANITMESDDRNDTTP